MICLFKVLLCQILYCITDKFSIIQVSFEKYRGKPTIVVNVATNCGYTKSNYKELNELYSKYEGQGLRIAAFPCNQFGGQEPGCDVDIKEFIKKKGVHFDMYSKVDVNGIYFFYI